MGFRLEPLLNGAAGAVDPAVIQHYEGGKKLHLEFKVSILRVVLLSYCGRGLRGVLG